MTQADISRPKIIRAPYRYFGEGVWARVREAYLAGESARLVCERLGPSEASIRKRAGRQGWTKRSIVPAQDALILEAAKAEAATRARMGETRAAGPLDPRAAARAALSEAVRLVRLGRMVAAMDATRVADMMARAAGRLDPVSPTPPQDEDHDDAAAFEAVRRKLGIPSPQDEG